MSTLPIITHAVCYSGLIGQASGIVNFAMFVTENNSQQVGISLMPYSQYSTLLHALVFRCGRSNVNIT